MIINFTVAVCPLVSVANAVANTTGCLTAHMCQTGTILEYTCTGNVATTKQVAVCNDNHTWDITPTCVEKENVSGFDCLCLNS